MGRPLNKKYFAARNANTAGTYSRSVADTGIGGSSIASIATGGTLTGYTSGAPSLSIFGPQLANGVQATAVAVLTAAAASVTSGGSGYPVSSTFTVSVTGSGAQGGGTAVLNVTTNSSGVITTVNSVTSGGTWTGATSGASALTAVGSTFTVAATFTLTSFTITSYSLTNNGGDGYIDSADTKSMSITATDGSGNVTVSSIDEMIPGMKFTPSQSIGGLTGGTGYYIKSVNTATRVITLSASVTGAGVGTLQATTAQPNSAALASVSQTAGQLTFTGTTTALPVGTAIAVTGTLSGNLTGVTSGTTYYVSSAVAPTTTAVTLSTSLAGALAGTGTVTVGGSTSTGLTFTYTVSDAVTIAGYTPVVTVSSGSATATATLAAQVSSGYTGRYEQIIVNANIGGTLYTDCDIIKQEGSRTYRVIQQGGTYPGTLCKLTAVGEGSLTTGQMAIIATDSAGGIYAVSKLTNRKAYLVPITGTQFTTGQAAAWTLTSATANVSVVLDNA